MTTRSTLRLPGALAVALVAGLLALPAEAQNIDLNLLSKQELGAGAGCSFSLWQADRDPQKDRYVYAFHETMDASFTRRPATMNVADKRLAFQRQSAGGRNPGFRLYEFMHYRTADNAYDVVLELNLSNENAGRITVNSGVLTLITVGKPPFRLAVKGLAECAPAPAAAPAAAASPPSNAPPPALRSYAIAGSKIPPALVAASEKQLNCLGADIRAKGATAYQFSDAQAIWMIPCEDGPDRVHFFARVSVEQPTTFTIVKLEAPPGVKRELGDYSMAAPRWNVAGRTVTNLPSDDQPQTCGHFETHQLVDGRLKLIEVRSKPDSTCSSGRPTKPSAFPITFQAK